MLISVQCSLDLCKPDRILEVGSEKKISFLPPTPTICLGVALPTPTPSTTMSLCLWICSHTLSSSSHVLSACPFLFLDHHSCAESTLSTPVCFVQVLSPSPVFPLWTPVIFNSLFSCQSTVVINTALIWMKCGPVSCVALRQDISLYPSLGYEALDSVGLAVLAVHHPISFPWGLCFCGWHSCHTTPFLTCMQLY